MTPGMWTSYLRDLSPEEMVVQFAKKGWTALELSTEHGDDLLKRGNPEETCRVFKTFAENHGVTFPQGHLWLKCDIAAVRQTETLDVLKGWLDLFSAAGVQAGVLHPGGREMQEQDSAPEAIREAQLAALEQLCAHLSGSDLVLCLENMGSMPDAQPLLDLIRTVNSPHLAICLDTGHLNLASGDQAAFIQQVGADLKALHIADNEGKTDQHMMPYGRGTVDWPVVMSALKQLPYEGLFNFEIPGENRCPLPIRLAKLDYIQALAEMMLQEG